MSLDQRGRLAGVDLLAAQRARVHLGQRVVQRLAEAERLVDRRVEAVEDAQLELVRTLEEVLEVGEREARRLRPTTCGVGCEPLARRVVGRAALHVLRRQHVVAEVRGACAVLVARHRRPGHVQELLARVTAT